MRRYAAVLVALCASCGPVYELKLPSQGGAPWVEYTSDHFRLQTNADDAAARATLKDVEERRSGLIRAAFHGAEVRSQRTRIVALRDAYELRAFMPEYILGYFITDIPELFDRERRGLGPSYGTSWALVFYLANNEGRPSTSTSARSSAARSPTPRGTRPFPPMRTTPACGRSMGRWMRAEGKKDAEETAFEKRIARMRDRLASYEKTCPAS